MGANSSLAFQVSCIRDLLPHARSDDLRSGAEAAIASLEWVERNAHLIKDFVRLMKTAPEALAVLTAWPDAAVTVRDLFDGEIDNGE